MTEHDWRLQAACQDSWPDMWFPEKGEDYQRQVALRICATCPVQRECGEFAFKADIPYGIWGGRTAKQRSTDYGIPAQKRPRESFRQPPPCGTTGGWNRHHRVGEEPCHRCRIAYNADYTERTKARAGQ